MLIFSSCTKSEGPAGSSAENPLTLESKYDAARAWSVIKSTCDAIHTKLELGKSIQETVSGPQAGSASITGDKTESSSSSSTSRSNTKRTEIYINFQNYQLESGSILNGTLRYYKYYYSRTACSSSGCASKSDDSRSIKGDNFSVSFQNDNGMWVSDLLSVSVKSPDYTYRWNGSITNSNGQSFSVN